jgi:hypothetical protein
VQQLAVLGPAPAIGAEGFARADSPSRTSPAEERRIDQQRYNQHDENFRHSDGTHGTSLLMCERIIADTPVAGDDDDFQ